MGLTEDRERFREVGETRREDLAEFISHGDLGGSNADRIRIPVKVVDLPSFEYDQRSAGGVGQGGDAQPQPGQPVDPDPGDGDEAGDPGEEGGDHEYYEMDPEEFARELDEALGLDLEPKGKQVVEEVEGDFTDTARAGPRGTLDVDEFFKRGLKRYLATDFDEAYVREGLFVDGADVDDVFAWARGEGIPVSRAWIADAAATLEAERGAPVAALDRWPSFEALADERDSEPVTQRIRREGLDRVPFRREDERFRHPEVIEKRERNVVVVNVRDASGSMRETKRELVERVFTPMDWYLTGKYDAAEFRYVVHDAEAWEVDREEFFGIQSGGGTRISSAYELVEEILEEYPYSEWNRYVFAAGDSENAGSDTTNNVIPLMESIDANLHAYVETQPGDGAANARHADEVETAFGDADDVAVARVSDPDDVTDAIYEILSTESGGGDAEAESLDEPAREARALAERLGLEPYPVRYWVVDHDQMNELIAYGGFQRRYPHWRWGMNYERQRKKDRHGLGKAFEIVNNDDPAHAFLQESNAPADQKAVITHVEAHADFFANNEWFGLYADRGEGGPNAAARLERNADRIASIAKRPDVDRDEVERLIDAVSALEDTIDQHSPVDAARAVEEPGIADDVSDGDEDAVAAIEARIDELDLSEEVRRDVFDDEWLEERGAGVEPEEPRPDVLAFLRDHGKRYDEDSGKAVDREPWETTVIDAIREEAYYFAGQKQTKVMNEGWATYWESVMMGGERFAGPDEFLTYADHMARVLGSPGLNPYKLGFELWTHVELRAARRDVTDKLLRVEGITPETFHSRVDLDAVADLLEPHPAIAGAGPDTLDELAELAADGDPRVDAEAVDRALSARDGAGGDGADIDIERYPWKLLTREGLAERHYVLSRPEHRGALRNVSREALEEQARYLFDVDRYETVAEAIADVDRTAGWDRMVEVRESHNDVTFIDAFLTDEFVREGNYFTYEYSRAAEEHRVASVDADDVRKKLLLQFTNFGKPTIVVLDGNFRNRGELLLGHRYNGVELDQERATATLKRVFELWGRPVNLATIRVEYDEGAVRRAKRRGEEPEGTEVGVRYQYDGGDVTEHDLDESIRERIAADEVDYDTKPDDWLA